MVILNILDILLSGLVFLLCFIGSGLPVWKRLSPQGRFGRFYEVVGVIAVGMLVVSLVVYILGVLGFYTRGVLLLALISLGFYLVNELKSIPLIKLKQTFILGKDSLQQIMVDLLLLAAVSPLIIFNFLTPILSGDSFYTFHVWAQHWGARSDLSYYSFGSFSSFLPCISSIIYKLYNSATDILPNERYLLNAMIPLVGFLSLALFVRALAFHCKSNAYLILGFAAAIALLYQHEFRAVLYAYRPDAFMILYISLLLLEISAYCSKKEGSTKDILRVAIWLSGLANVEGTGIIMALLFSLSLFILTGQQTGRRWLESIGIRIGVVFICLGAVVVTVGPYRLQQQNIAQKPHYKSLADHTFPPMTTLLTQQKNATLQKILDGPQSWKREMQGAFHALYSLALPLDKRENDSGKRLKYKITPIVLILGLFLGGASLFIWTLLGVFLTYLFWWWFFVVSGPAPNSLHMAMNIVLLVFASATGWLCFISKIWDKVMIFLTPKYRQIIMTLILSFCIMFAVIGFIRYSWKKELGEILPKGMFYSQSTYERLKAYYPEGADAVHYVANLIAEEAVPSQWDKFMVAADHPWDRLIPNAFNTLNLPLRWREGRPEDHLTIVKTRQFPGGVKLGDTWVAPSLALYKKVSLQDGLTEWDGNWKTISDLTQYKGMLLALRDSSENVEKFRVNIGANLVSDKTWQYQFDDRVSSGDEQTGANKCKHVEEKYLYGKHAYGQDIWSLGVLTGGMPESYGYWIGVPTGEDGKMIADTVTRYRKIVRVKHRQEARIRISTFGSDKAEIYINGRKVGARTKLWTALDIVPCQLGDGDELEIRVIGAKHMIFVDVEWDQQSAIRYLGTAFNGSKEIVNYVYRSISDKELKVLQKSHSIDISDILSLSGAGVKEIKYLPMPKPSHFD